MNTEQFFRLVLPASGLKVLAELVPIPGQPKSGWRYTTFESFAHMAEAALQLDAAGRTIYHACNSFGAWYLDTKKNKRRLRTQANVVACRSLYDDIDIGKPDAYASRKDAGEALKSFVKTTGLPMPTVIYSGGGLHLYWAMTEDISQEAWQQLSNKKRLAAEHFGLKTDRSCDTDSARVLRPVGTTWRKLDDREIVCRYEGKPSDPNDLESTLDKYLAANNVSSPVISNAVPEWMQGTTGNLSEQVTEFPPSFIEVIAEHCQQIRIFKETGSDSEPIWHACAGIAKHCVDGAEKFHEWSASYDGYDQSEAQEKLDNWGAGPTLCEKFKSVNADGCKGCKKTCKTPVALGLKMEETLPESLTVLVAEPDGTKKPKSFELPELWPVGFTYEASSDTIYGTKKNEEGEVVRVSVASPLFYVVDSIQSEDGTSSLVFERLIRGKTSRFEVPTKFTAELKSLKPQLAAYRITAMDPLVQKFVTSQMIANRQKQDEINTYSQLGWHHEGHAFLLGSKLITAEGSTTVRVGKAINDELTTIGTKAGDVHTWVNGVNELYNQPGAEPYQLAVCLAFGGIFGPLMPSAQWRGIPFALTSDRSGLGKSTACKIGLNIYCQADLTMVTDSTPKGMIVRTGAMGNLPFLLDEVTKYVVEAKDMSDLLYALSNGKGRVGSTGEGVERKNALKWNVPVMLTGNRNILHHVTEHNLNPEAAQMRVFEVDLETYPILPEFEVDSKEHALLGMAHKALTDDLISNHYGIIGEDWIRWTLANRGEIRKKLADVGTKLRTAMYGGNASKERYYYDLATMMLVGGYFAKKLGYIQFDLNALKTWIVKHIATMRAVSEENQSTPEDLFAHLMSDLNGRLLVTNRFDGADRRSATTVEMDQAGVRGAVDGRVVCGTEDERPRVYVAIRSVTQWCAKNGVQYSKFKRDLMALNLIRLGTPGCNKSSGAVRIRIGKGVAAHEHLGQVNCLEFDARAAQKHLSTPVVPIHQQEEEAA